MQAVTWLLLLYSLPAEPSAPRVQVWRRVNELGALRLPAGGYALPEDEHSLANLEALVSEIAEHDGSAALFRAEPLSPALEVELRERFNAARSADYAEIERESVRLRSHVQREIEHFVFTYEELEELDAELNKIRQRLELIERRDAFGVPARSLAEDAVVACETLLVSYTEQVFQQAAPEEPAE